MSKDATKTYFAAYLKVGRTRALVGSFAQAIAKVNFRSNFFFDPAVCVGHAVTVAFGGRLPWKYNGCHRKEGEGSYQIVYHVEQ